MICFQFQFFVLLLPTQTSTHQLLQKLWFAFNFSSLYYCYQRLPVTVNPVGGCDLLSISVLCIIVTNIVTFSVSRDYVVICFQFQFFVLLLPTKEMSNITENMLWFAFNFSSLYYCYQLNELVKVLAPGCDLLSISVLCIIVTNASRR